MSGGKAPQGTPEKPHHERNTTASFVDDGNNNNNNNSNIAITEFLNSHPSSDTVSSSVLSGGGIVGQKKKGSKRGGAIRKIFRKIIDPLSNKKSGRSDDHDDPDDDMFGLPVLGDAPVSTKYGAGNSKRKLGSVHSLVGFDVSDSDGAGVGGGGKAAKRLGSSNSRLSNSSMAEVGLPPPTARFRWVPGMHRNNNNTRNQQQQGYHPFVLAALNRYQHMVAMNNTQQQQQQQMRYMQTMKGGATRQAQQGPYTAHASGGGGGSQTAQGGLAGTEPGGYDDYHAGEYGGQGGGYYGTNTVDDILTGRGGEYNSSPATIDNNMGGEESTSGPYLPSDVQSFYGPIGVEGRAAAKRRKAMEAKGETAGMDFQTLMSSCWCNPEILTQARWVRTPPMHLLEDWEGDDGGGVSDGENTSDVYPNRTNGSNTNNNNTPQMFNHMPGQVHGEANPYAANAQPGGVGRTPPPRFTATCATQQPFGAAGTAGRQPKAPPQQQQQQQQQPQHPGFAGGKAPSTRCVSAIATAPATAMRQRLVATGYTPLRLGKVVPDAQGAAASSAAAVVVAVAAAAQLRRQRAATMKGTTRLSSRATTLVPTASWWVAAVAPLVVVGMMMMMSCIGCLAWGE